MLNPPRCARRMAAKSSTVRILDPQPRHRCRTQGLCYGGPGLGAEGGPELDADHQPDKCPAARTTVRGRTSVRSPGQMSDRVANPDPVPDRSRRGPKSDDRGTEMDQKVTIGVSKWT